MRGFTAGDEVAWVSRTIGRPVDLLVSQHGAAAVGAARQLRPRTQAAVDARRHSAAHDARGSAAVDARDRPARPPSLVARDLERAQHPRALTPAEFDSRTRSIIPARTTCSSGRRRLAVLLVLAIVAPAGPRAVGRPAQAAVASPNGAWHPLVVPGGRATLTALGVSDSRDRATAFVELVRRLHFAFTPPTTLESAVRTLKDAAREGGESRSVGSDVVLPSPLAPTTWNAAIFRRDVPATRLVLEILADAPARLLWHGLAGLDAETRRWFGGQPDLLRRLYDQDTAVRAFALFAPALRVVEGRVVVPGGDIATRRWSGLIDTPVDRPGRFIARLFDHHDGRTAGLYFLAASVEPARQRFLLSATSVGDAGDRSFTRLVSSFARCYPPNSTATYPFAVRSHDAALLLLELGLTRDGAPAGPASRTFWQRVFDGPPRPGERTDHVDPVAGGADIDAAWIVEMLCAAPSATRASVFTALLAGHRTFAALPLAEWPDGVVALRARQAYPALFMALEHAGVRSSRTYAVVAAHAARLARVDDPDRANVALRQFQGALALTLNAARAQTFDSRRTSALVESLAAVPFNRERYDGGVAEWIQTQWLPAVAAAAPRAGAPPAVEGAVAVALAGPADAARPTRALGRPRLRGRPRGCGPPSPAQRAPPPGRAVARLRPRALTDRDGAAPVGDACRGSPATRRRPDGMGAAPCDISRGRRVREPRGAASRPTSRRCSDVSPAAVMAQRPTPRSCATSSTSSSAMCWPRGRTRLTSARPTAWRSPAATPRCGINSACVRVAAAAPSNAGRCRSSTAASPRGRCSVCRWRWRRGRSVACRAT